MPYDLAAGAPRESVKASSAGVRRQARFSARRRHLGELAIELIQERGFAALSVNEVAERASMSVGGLYRYIKTKSDLLEMVCDAINLGLYDRMREAAAAERGITAKLSAAIRIYGLTCWDSASAILVAYREFPSLSFDAQARYLANEKRIAELLADLVRAGIASDEFRSVDERLMAHEVILLAHMKALKGWSLHGRERDDVLAEHLDLILSRLRAQTVLTA